MNTSLSSARQLRFHQLLVGARKTWLREALATALAHIDPIALRLQLADYVPVDVQRILAIAGIRDEQVFPVPVVIEAAPNLVGYYRLLLGIPQKSFYTSATGMGRFKLMEEKGVLKRASQTSVPEFCRVMSEPLADLVRQISPTITAQDIAELPLLTLGSQFQGGNNNRIGKVATDDVFLAVSELVSAHVLERTEQRITVRNSSGRLVIIALASDPDISINEAVGDSTRKIVAIEIKGGSDRSNAHNRAGEAEKSHQKARQNGYRDFWTLIATRGLDIQTLKGESPTTNAWFDVSQVLAREGDDWDDFVNNLSAVVGIPIATDHSRQDLNR